ncbi:MAG: hypothetical protein NVSMB43_26090 [Pseudarthrobacter sp.]
MLSPWGSGVFLPVVDIGGDEKVSNRGHRKLIGGGMDRTTLNIVPALRLLLGRVSQLGLVCFGTLESCRVLPS